MTLNDRHFGRTGAEPDAAQDALRLRGFKPHISDLNAHLVYVAVPFDRHPGVFQEFCRQFIGRHCGPGSPSPGSAGSVDGGTAGVPVAVADGTGEGEDAAPVADGAGDGPEVAAALAPWRRRAGAAGAGTGDGCGTGDAGGR